MATGEQQPNSPQDEAEQFSPGSCKWKLGRRKTEVLLFVSGVLVGIIVTLVFGIAPKQPSCSPRSHFSHVCPNAWLGFQGKCYYFSNTESDWNSSRKHCQRLGASLATVDTEEEKVGLLSSREQCTGFGTNEFSKRNP
ncbi:C-type lectin domain family 2 member B-like [Phasianus colchicus]|uniref:C-type lectin domain family 2 member B-like n=1 Tax=Phasianus colchicus TaxID=9054 RepID=UPI00129E2B94|nr:C-type lectin domain family 2 member B-like [Phasianus colchicus]